MDERIFLFSLFLLFSSANGANGTSVHSGNVESKDTFGKGLYYTRKEMIRSEVAKRYILTWFIISNVMKP